MDYSLADWLALREPADAAARSVTLTRAIADSCPRDRPVRVVDLGTGTGSNVRYLAPHLPSRQDWLLVDNDPVLLDEMRARMSSWDPGHGLHCRIKTRRLNLGAADPEVFAGRDLVTASALLDLVSEAWLALMVDRCRHNRATVLLTLTYNGRSFCSPPEPEDDTVRELLNRHQKQSDKGFGPAAGPDAVDCAERLFLDAGYRVQREASDWLLTSDASELQRQLIDGWVAAAVELAPSQAPTITDWRARRLAHVDAHRSRIVVCHEDLAAWPSPARMSIDLPIAPCKTASSASSNLTACPSAIARKSMIRQKLHGSAF